MEILYKRNLETSTVISSLDLSIGYDLDSLYDTRLATYTQFTSGSDIIRIHVEFDTALTVDAIGVGGHNFGPDATLSVNNGSPQPFGQRHAIIFLDAPISATSFDFEFKDPLLSPGDTRYIGRLELGEYYQPPDISHQLKVDAVSNSEAIFSSSRQVYGYRKSPYSRISIQMPLVEIEEGRDLIAFFRYVDVFIPFFVSFDKECFEIRDNYVVLSENNLLAFQLTEGKFYQSSMILSEVF